jgi:polyribonucleotide 5'-hydroxyl-kinase
VENPVDIEEVGFPGEPPLVFYYGSCSPSENPSLYKHCVERLAAVLNDRCSKDPAARAAGMIANSMGWVEGLGYDLLLHSINTLDINTILVVGQDRLHSQMKASLKDKKGAHILI